MAEGARLESVYTGNRIEGSNPSLTANPSFSATEKRRTIQKTVMEIVDAFDAKWTFFGLYD